MLSGVTRKTDHSHDLQEYVKRRPRERSQASRSDHQDVSLSSAGLVVPVRFSS